MCQHGDDFKLASCRESYWDYRDCFHNFVFMILVILLQLCYCQWKKTRFITEYMIPVVFEYSHCGEQSI